MADRAAQITDKMMIPLASQWAKSPGPIRFSIHAGWVYAMKSIRMPITLRASGGTKAAISALVA